MITSEESAVIVKLRQNIGDEFPTYFTTLTVEDQDLYLVRWIRARNLNLEKATDMLRKSLTWRTEMKTDQALDFKLHPFFAENFPFNFSGIDKLGQPGEIVVAMPMSHLSINLMFLLPYSDWDLRKVVNDVDRLAEFDDFAMFVFETFCKHIKEEHQKRRASGEEPVTQTLLLLDVKDFAYMQLINLGAIKRILHLTAIYEAHYPEILYRAIFINCPHYFGMFITMLKPVIAPKTLGKIICYPKMSDWQNDMKELLDPVHIPERYGGSKT